MATNLWRRIVGAVIKQDAAVSPALSSALRVVSGQPTKRRGASEIIEAYSTSPWLHSTVQKIAQHVASAEYTLGRVTGKAGKAVARRIKAAPVRSRAAMIKRAGNVELADVLDHPFWDLIERPNPWMRGQEFLAVSQLCIDLVGEMLWHATPAEPPAKGLVALLPIPPHWVQQYPDRQLSPERQVYKVRTEAGSQAIPASEIIRIKTPNPDNPYGCGVGLGITLADEVDTDEAVSKWVKMFFGNNARPDFMVGIEGAEQDSVERAQAAFEMRHRGSQSAHQAHFYGGKLTITELSKSFGEMKVNALREFERQAFWTVYGMPPEIMGWTSASSRAAAQQALSTFGEQVLDPRLGLIASALQQVADLFNDVLVVGYESPVPEDWDMRLEAMTAAPWAATVNEWRELQGLEPLVTGGDLHMVPVGVTFASPAAAMGVTGGSSDGKSIADLMSEMDDAELGAALASAGRVRGASPKLACGCTADPVIAATKALAYDELTQSQRDTLERLLTEEVQPEPLRVRLNPKFEESVEEWGQRAIDEVGAEVTFSKIDPRVLRHLEELSGERISGIVDTTRDLLRNALSEGVLAGEAIPALSQRVEDILNDGDKLRATRIARTEVNRSANFATQAGYKQSGLVDLKQWVATLDDRTRDEHIELDGDTVPLDQPFVYNGATAMQPGDFGVASLDINCRCTTIAVITDPKGYDDRRAVHKGFVEQTQSWEDETRDLVAEAFREQARGVVAGLGRLA